MGIIGEEVSFCDVGDSMFKKEEDKFGVRYLSTLNKIRCVNDVAILWKKRDPLEESYRV